MAREALLAETFIGGGERELAAAAGEETQLLGDVGLFDLLEAFQQVLERAPAEPFGHLEPIRWSVPDKMAAILALLRRQAVVAFSRLFHDRSPRGEIIVTFLSLLELLRLRQVTVRQGRQFAEIEILPVPEASSVTGEDSAAAAASAQEVVHVG
jgi:segregation and condensation protein A